MSTQRFILINVSPPSLSKEESLKDLEELKSLVSTYGGATIVRVIQRRENPDGHSYIGKGKALEVADMVKKDRIDVVVLNGIVKPGQLFNLEKIFWPSNNNIQVWDKIDLILHIFDKHAHTAEAKLQIEIARMRHMGPRIYGMGHIMSRQGGGIGTRGIGETNTERMKRHWRDEMKKVQEKLAKISKVKQRQMEKRREVGLQTVSIIGYTNAGKSTLFNTLTGKRKLAQDVLFATLDSTVGKLYLPNLKKEIMISDTIGFIQNLPPSLITAFKSTLMESIHADMLLHVIDVSDPDMHKKIAVVEEILHEMGIHNKQKMYVFNKIDMVEDGEQVLKEINENYAKFHPQFISAQHFERIEELKKYIEYMFSPEYKDQPLSNTTNETVYNYAYNQIVTLLEKGVVHDFPHNLGLLFLIENYLSYYLSSIIKNGLLEQHEHEKAHLFETKLVESMTLGQLYDMAEQYIGDLDLSKALNSIIRSRNRITHDLLEAQDKRLIEKEAQEAINEIYREFLQIKEKVKM